MIPNSSGILLKWRKKGKVSENNALQPGLQINPRIRLDRAFFGQNALSGLSLSFAILSHSMFSILFLFFTLIRRVFNVRSGLKFAAPFESSIFEFLEQKDDY